MLKEKRIPTILGLIILIGGIYVGVVLNNNGTNVVSKASSDCIPKNTQITNITNNSVSISFTTEAECLSNLSINNQNIRNGVTNDDNEKTKIHYFDISNLEDETEYKYTIISDGKKYNESLYKFKTAQKPNSLAPSSNLAWGRVFTPELKAASKVIVFINIPGASPLSALVTSSGNWNISLANSFNEETTDRFTPKENTPQEIVVIDKEKNITQISSNTSRNNPSPDIILGQNEFSASSVNFDSESNVGSLPVIDPMPKAKELDILNPKDNESLSTKKPDFFGTGPANSKIKIKVESPVVYTGEVKTKDDGSWNWSPPKNLTPGEHTITVTVIQDGIEKIISRKFTVLATDSPLSYSASPSATTPTPTLIPTAIPTVKPTVVPTLIPTAIPTAVARNTTTLPSTSSGVPVTGSLVPTILLSIISLLFVSFSFLTLKKK